MPKLTDANLIERAARELANHAPCQVTLDSQRAFQLVGLLQLALRHPQISLEVRDVGDKCLAAARTYFSTCPAVLEIIKRGDDPHAATPPH